MASDGPAETVYVTMEEVGRHVTHSDCWTVINGKVYDLTTFMDEHPGGGDVLLAQAAGRDATKEFEDVGHSEDAIEQMNDFYVGECPQPLEKAAALNTSRLSDWRRCKCCSGTCKQHFEQDHSLFRASCAAGDSGGAAEVWQKGDESVMPLNASLFIHCKSEH